MTETEARALLTGEGMEEDFDLWVLSAPPTTQPRVPLYFFVYDEALATVNTATGAVAAEDME